MIYLASPYTHPEPQVRARRYICAREYVWDQMRRGVDIFSPVVYGHQFARDFAAPIDADYWQSFNRAMFEACAELHVLTLTGWEISVGVQMEINWAETSLRVVRQVEPLPYATI